MQEWRTHRNNILPVYNRAYIFDSARSGVSSSSRGAPVYTHSNPQAFKYHLILAIYFLLSKRCWRDDFRSLCNENQIPTFVAPACCSSLLGHSKLSNSSWIWTAHSRASLGFWNAIQNEPSPPLAKPSLNKETSYPGVDGKDQTLLTKNCFCCWSFTWICRKTLSEDLIMHKCGISHFVWTELPFFPKRLMSWEAKEHRISGVNIAYHKAAAL